MDTVIVTKHDGAVEWLRRRGIVGEVVTHINAPEQVRGRRVIGILPIHLAAEAGDYIALEMDLPPEARGKDLTPEEMDRYGARLRRYRIFPEEFDDLDILLMSSDKIWEGRILNIRHLAQLALESWDLEVMAEHQRRALQWYAENGPEAHEVTEVEARSYSDIWDMMSELVDSLDI